LAKENPLTSVAMGTRLVEQAAARSGAEEPVRNAIARIPCRAEMNAPRTKDFCRDRGNAPGVKLDPTPKILRLVMSNLSEFSKAARKKGVEGSRPPPTLKRIRTRR